MDQEDRIVAGKMQQSVWKLTAALHLMQDIPGLERISDSLKAIVEDLDMEMDELLSLANKG